MSALSNIFKRKTRPRRWIFRPEDLPWFDQPDALERLERRHRDGGCSDVERDLLEKWINDGYCVADGLIDPGNIEGMLRDLEEIWTTEKPIRHLEILGAKLRAEDSGVIPHYELVKMDPARRKLIRETTPWRVHNFFVMSKSAAAIHDSPALRRLASLIFGRDGVPGATINFMYGSRQALHQDMTVFHIFPMNYLIGVWLACEDISPDGGPLVFYPGSHRHPMFSKFDNYPQTSLKTCDSAVREEYEVHLKRLAEGHERRRFIARKGQVLFWHGMLIHGGDEVKNPALTRKSYVCHYVPEGMDRIKEIVGPFNW